MELQKIEAYVNTFFADQNEGKNPFHNFSYTKELVNTTQKIASHYSLDDETWFVVCAAAWFKNTGYRQGVAELPEQQSAAYARKYLETEKMPETIIAAVCNCILSTSQPETPETLAEKILCDAGSYYFGTDAFKEKRKLLRKEREQMTGEKIDENQWIAAGISLLEQHNYYTDYCRSLLQDSKALQIERLKNRQQKKLANEQEASDNKIDAGALHPGEGMLQGKKHKILKEDQPVKGIEMMFRVSSGNNVRISVMADNKAHILITVNSIIISVILGLIIRNLEENRNFIIPSVILVTVNVLTIIYSVLATMPKLNKGTFTHEQVKNKSINILYFGSFFNMNFDEYKSAINAVMHDSEFMYACLTKDLYWQGRVLGRKYKLLRYAYIIFLYGIVTSVLAFLIAVLVSD